VGHSLSAWPVSCRGVGRRAPVTGVSDDAPLAVAGWTCSPLTASQRLPLLTADIVWCARLRFDQPVPFASLTVTRTLEEARRLG
jgi:hypothetical protein